MRFVWAFPVTALGLLLVGLAILTGSRARIIHRVLECWGGMFGRFLAKAGMACLTLGYVTFGVGAEVVTLYRDHERVHTRQYGTWGVFLLPAYLVSSFWAWTHHQDPWGDNWFERQAIDESGI